MEILTALGVDNTIFYQFAIFIVTYIVLAKVVFNPYLKAYFLRQEATTGNEAEADDIMDKAEALKKEYETEARELNLNIKETFDKAKQEASKVAYEKITETRKEADLQVKANREQLQNMKDKLVADVDAEIPALSSVVVHKLLGKELN